MTHHYYHHQDQKTDLPKMQADALKGSLDDRYRQGEDGVVHHHKHGESCTGKLHDEYKRPTPKVVSEEATPQEVVETTGWGWDGRLE